MNRSVFAKSAARPLAGVLLGAFAAIALTLLSGTARAAPQSLGLVATQQPVPLLCDTDRCVAQLSSFCLQRARKAPNHGTVYHVAGGAGTREIPLTRRSSQATATVRSGPMPRACA